MTAVAAPTSVPLDPRTNQPYRERYISAARAELYLIEQSRKNPAAFMYYLSEYRPAQHHLLWIHNILEHNLVNIIAPRESAKTTVSVYMMAWLIGKNPLLTHFIGSVAEKQAQDRLEMIREIIEHNQRFKNVFPHVYIDYKKTNNKSEFSVWADSLDGGTTMLEYSHYRSIVTTHGDPKNPTLFAAGAGSSQIIGRRFSGICLVDDPHSEANSATESLREKVYEWFHKTLLPCVKEGGKTILISTRWAMTDLSGRLKEALKPDGTPLWKTVEISAIDSEGNSYWPEYWSVERLDEKRVEIGEIMFQLMYMNNPLGLASNQFSPDHFRLAIPIPPPEYKSIVVSTDFAVTSRSQSDYTVFCAMARDDKRNYDIFILDLIRIKTDYHQAIEELAKFCERVASEHGKLDRVLVEKQALSIPVFHEIRSSHPELPVEQVVIKGDKGTRLSAVYYKAQRGGLWVNPDIEAYNAMVSELVAYPRTPNDDIVDAVSLPLQYWGTSQVYTGTLKVFAPMAI